MSLRCRKGDLAIVVRSQSGNEGRIVRCMERYDGLFHNPLTGETGQFGPAWVIDPPLPCLIGAMAWAALDEQLRPIRNPGDDEIDVHDVRLGEAMRTQVNAGVEA